VVASALTRPAAAQAVVADDVAAALLQSDGLALGDILLSVAVEDGEEPVVVDAFEQVEVKAKVQLWPASHFEEDAVAARAAARFEAAAVAALAEREARAVAEAEAARVAATKEFLLMVMPSPVVDGRIKVESGLGRIVALQHRSSASCQIH